MIVAVHQAGNKTGYIRADQIRAVMCRAHITMVLLIDGRHEAVEDDAEELKERWMAALDEWLGRVGGEWMPVK